MGEPVTWRQLEGAPERVLQHRLRARIRPRGRAGEVAGGEQRAGGLSGALPEQPEGTGEYASRTHRPSGARHGEMTLVGVRNERPGRSALEVQSRGPRVPS